MSKAHFSAMDTHSKTTDICVKTRAHSPGKQFRVETNIRAIREVIEEVSHPRKLTFEEGPMAGWLFRECGAEFVGGDVGDVEKWQDVR